jgi:hypothetical protein
MSALDKRIKALERKNPTNAIPWWKRLLNLIDSVGFEQFDQDGLHGVPPSEDCPEGIGPYKSSSMIAGLVDNHDEGIIEKFRGHVSEACLADAYIEYMQTAPAASRQRALLLSGLVDESGTPKPGFRFNAYSLLCRDTGNA